MIVQSAWEPATRKSIVEVPRERAVKAGFYQKMP